MIQGPEPGSVYRLPDNRVTTIGRSSQNKVTVVNRSVSRFHCEVACVNGRWELTDLNSRRGTMLNNEWVEDSVTLEFGDIIRMSNVIFRFDEYEQGVGEQAALLAIKEAELNRKLIPKGEADIGMDEIMLRSRLESKSRLEARRKQRRAFHVNLVFLLTVGITVLLGLGGTLLWAHGLLPGTAGVKPPREPGANAGDEQLPSPGEQDNRPEPQPDPDTPPEPPAMPLKEAWTLVTDALEEASKARLEGNYADALQALALDLDEMPPAPRKRVEQEREATEAMARAWYEEQAARAADLAREGKAQQAADLYARAADRVGIAELARRARQQSEEALQNSTP